MINKEAMAICQADYYVGLDNSLTCTAITILDSEGNHIKTKAFVGDKILKQCEKDPLNKGAMKMIDYVFTNKQRAKQIKKMFAYELVITNEIINLKHVDFDKDKICVAIENYAYGAKGKQTVLAELGGILRHALIKLVEKITEIAPQSLKKFVVGKGNAPKDLMLLSIYKRYKEDFADIPGKPKIDAADSYGCAKIAYHYFSASYDGLTKAQMDVIAKIRETEMLS